MAHDYSEDAARAPAASETLDTEQDLINFAFKASNVGYWVWNIQTGHFYLSATSLKMMDLSEDAFSGRIEDIKALIHPDDYYELKTSINMLIENACFFELEFRVRRQDKSYLWISIDGRAVNDDAGAPHKIGGSIVDASDYVDIKNRLEQEKRNLRLIFDNVPARIWVKDSHNTILRLNEKAAASMNMSVVEVEGANTYDLFPEQAKKYHEADLAVIRSGGPLNGIVEKYTPKDSAHGWVSTDKLPFVDPETNEKQILVISTDITQQIEYETEILENSARLDRANKDLYHFAYMASHDLKAPLNGMGNLAQWIEEDLGETITPDIKKNLNLLRGRVSRMEALLKDILAFSRAGKNMAAPETVEIEKMVEDITQWLAPPDGFRIVRDTALPVLEIPRSAIEHIFLNLISNAIKHHDRDEGTIHIGYDQDELTHKFHVSDDGPGIPEEYQDRVFEIFRKLAPRDNVEGSGIGLAIVKKMTETLGGTIKISSEDGKRGTTFNIHIPAD